MLLLLEGPPACGLVFRILRGSPLAAARRAVVDPEAPGRVAWRARPPADGPKRTADGPPPASREAFRPGRSVGTLTGVETFVSLGNGLVQDRLADLVGEPHLIRGIVEWGATNKGPGHLAQTTEGPFVVGPRDARTERLAEVLAPAGAVRIEAEIRSVIWAKLLVNSVFSGLGAVAGETYAEVVARPEGKDAALRMWREGYEVGTAQGLRPGKVLGVEASALAAGDEQALATAMRRHGATYASMLQDLKRGAPTEVDVIVGAVAAKGREHGIPTPLHDRVTALIHAAERGERTPSPEGLTGL